MPPQVWAALIGAVGVLTGVVTGALLSAFHQGRAWKREEAARSRDERRRLFADFLTAARDWRAATQHPDTRLVRGSAVSRSEHADGGIAAVRTLGLRSEIALLGQPAIIRQAREVTRSQITLAESRAKYPAGSLPDRLVAACRNAEVKFLVAARKELGIATAEAELEEALRHLDSDPADTAG